MNDFIHEYGTLTEFDLLVVAERYLHEGCTVYAVHTDHFYCGAELKVNVKHLMELRIFSANDELKISRLNIGQPFQWRYINDDTFKQLISAQEDDFLQKFSNRIYDEEHYLDIDATKSEGVNYTTTGGGRYTLPVEYAEKIKIRNYLTYDENGIVIISDFRIVGFIQKGSVENGKI